MWIDKMELEKSYNALASRLTHRSDWYVNCGGYAFEFEGWYSPNVSDDEAWKMYHDASTSGDWASLENTLVSRILSDFPGWKETKVLAEGHEYVAFRIRKAAFFCDFHFMKFDGMRWTQKCGHLPTDDEWFKLEDIYEPEAWGVYDGKLFVFEKA